MKHGGTARLDRRTKDLVKRLGSNDIAIIDHVDMDRVSAESLLETGVEVVVNAAQSISGVYPNIGPLLLARGGVRIVDNVGSSVFDEVREGDPVVVVGADVLADGKRVANGELLTIEAIEHAMEESQKSLGDQLDRFARNTLEYMQREKELLTHTTNVPRTRTDMAGKHALVVVRGYDYKHDLDTLKPYIREIKPVLIGVDGGADAIIEAGFKPAIVIGDMDSVTDGALRSGAELIVHAYPDGRCPGAERLAALGLEWIEWALLATSEDLGLLLPYESGADLVVAVGTHDNLVEYLDKGRKGMASTFLVRLKVGPKLVDAKGVSKLYRTSVGPADLVWLVGAALVAITVILLIAPPVRGLLSLWLLQLRTVLGI